MSYDRRAFVEYFASAGLGSTLLPGVLWSRISEGEDITAQTVACAEEMAGLVFTEEERAMMVDGLKQQAQRIGALHKVVIPNDVAPAIIFNPLPPGVTPGGGARRLASARAPRMVRSRVPTRARPENLDELAFLPVTELSEHIRTRKVSSTELTDMYLGRIRKYNPALQCVITVTEERARKQAREADREIARGKYRGPLHGIPGAQRTCSQPKAISPPGAPARTRRRLSMRTQKSCAGWTRQGQCSSPSSRSASWRKATTGLGASPKIPGNWTRDPAGPQPDRLQPPRLALS
ncbi:MAG: amidase family protein, partial [Gemmatimonadota bacterium]|nr:amidase family protein [Gemmatimonadota bacterium]